MAERNLDGANTSRGAFLLPFAIGAGITATVCVVSSYLQVRLRILALWDELLWMVVPGVVVAILWITIWRQPLRRIGRADGKRRSEIVERLVTIGIAMFWIAASALQIGLDGVLSERSTFPDVPALRGARVTRIVEIKQFDLDRKRCVRERAISYPKSASYDATVELDVACPFQAGGDKLWLAWRHVEKVAQKRLRDGDERSGFLRAMAEQTDDEIRELPQQVTYFERIATDAVARRLAAKAPPGAEFLLAKVTPYEDEGFGALVASGITLALLVGILLFVPIERAPVSPDV